MKEKFTMFEITISIKSGSGGYHDEDGCDCLVSIINMPVVPRIGETISILTDTQRINSDTGIPYAECKDYLVRDVVYSCVPKDTNTFITCYVVPIN